MTKTLESQISIPVIEDALFKTRAVLMDDIQALTEQLEDLKEQLVLIENALDECAKDLDFEA